MKNPAKGRAYSLITIKAMDDDKREITGIATTPEPDRMGDIVEVDGAEYKLPIPFLWQHDSLQPIGEVYAAKKTKDGIEIKARLVKVDSPSQLAARLDEAWQSIKTGLVRGLSIGFSAVEYAFMDDGGIRFIEWNWHELSAVTIPANASASIATVKSFDNQAMLAASGTKAKPIEKALPSGVTEKKLPKVKLITPKEDNMKTIKEQLDGFRKTLELKKQKQMEIVTKNGDGETLDAAAQEEFDTLTSEISEVEKHIERLEIVEKSALQNATQITEKAGSSEAAGANARKPLAAQVKATENLEKGIGFARFARIKGLAYTGEAGTRDEAQIAKMLYPNDEKLIKSIVEKAAVPAANTLSSTWAGNLINEGGIAFADFVEYLRPRSLYGQISSRFRNLPFDTPVLVQGSGGSAQWVKEGEAKPLTQWTYTRTKLTPLKVAAIAAVTKETLMRASVSADAFLRDELARSAIARIDGTLISDDAAVADESPAGLLNGTTELTLVGDGTVAGIRCDIATFLKSMSGNLLSVSGAFWVMSENTAIDLSMATNEVGAPAFPGVTPTGGTLAGLPVFTSQYVPVDSTGPVVALIKGDEIFLGDEGGIQVKTSDQATLQMDSAPTQNSITPTATTGVSMFQTNSVAFLVERFLNWQKRRSTSVVYAHVNWDACSGQS